MIAVTTENRSLLIYHHSELVWCAQLLDQTIGIQRGNFVELAGGLITLTSTGKVAIGYLGSNPDVFKVPSMNLAKLDYDKSKQELEEMEKEITSVDISFSGKKHLKLIIYSLTQLQFNSQMCNISTYQHRKTYK